MLTDDATFGMPPYPAWCRGREALADSWLMPEGPSPRLRYRRTRANGQPALGTYVLDRDAANYVPLALDVLALRGDRIVDVTAFRMPDVFPRFGLPARMPVADAR
jgi:RNA polymerase sigma-70 factor (ECF subfamily)